MKVNSLNEINDEIRSATCLLLAVSYADNHVDKKELEIIQEIIIDFFNIELNVATTLIEECISTINQSTDIYEFGKILNDTFNYNDKINFICCTYEVAFTDKRMDYLENHVIKKIANILNVEHSDIIKSKNEIKRYLSID